MADLADRFTELIHIPWDHFVAKEHDETATSADAMLLGLIRACSDGDMRSIKIAFSRSDGEVEIPVQFNVPKFYVRYINAKSIEGGKAEQKKLDTKIEEKKYDIATDKLRATLNEMKKAPKKLVQVILDMRQKIDDDWKHGRPLPEPEIIPMVKSVIVANLLQLTHYGNSAAIVEVFNQIDGKLAKTITLLGGNDVYIDNHEALIAPAHATKDDSGCWVAENKEMTNIWIRGLSKTVPQLIIGDENEEDFS